MSRLVLLVDDITDNRDIYRDYLEHKGYRVEEASNAREALQKATALRPDIVIMDLAMPGTNGFEAIRALRADERTQSLKVLALTAYATFVAKEMANEAGCDGFLPKPCTPEELESVIRAELEA